MSVLLPGDFLIDRMGALQWLSEESATITTVGERLARCMADGKTVAWCGNGGSMADALHAVTEFTVRFSPYRMSERPALPAVALASDPVFLTACSNDFGFNSIFSRALESVPGTGILVAMTTSGKSQNIHTVLRYANKKNIPAVVLTGEAGPARLEKFTLEACLAVPSGNTALIQEVHQTIIHLWAAKAEEYITGQ